MENKKVDLLSRDGFVENVIKLVEQLSKNRQGCCFAIEGGWGVGKTFVIEQIEDCLNVLQSEDTNDDKYFVFHYNCWQYDYYEEPAVAIVSAMLTALRKHGSVINGEGEKTIKAGWNVVENKLKEIVKIYVKNKIGVDIVSWLEEIKEVRDENEKAENLFDERYAFNKAIEEVQKQLLEIAETRTIVFVIDELDRCVPQYAIKVLERVHHIFSGLTNVVVIMAIDRSQLEHSVGEMFGLSEKAVSIEKYLKKFIDFSITLDSGKINENLISKYNFYFEKFEVNEKANNKEVVDIVSELFTGMDIRIQEKLIEKIDVVHSVICNEKVDSSVMIFEILYEMLKIWGVGDMKNLALINRAKYPELEERLGSERFEYIKWLERKAEGNVKLSIDEKGEVKGNVFGDIFWYFASIYNADDMPYYPRAEEYENRDMELDIVRRYCDFSEIMN